MSDLRVLHVFKRFRPEFTGEGIFLERLAPVFRDLRADVKHEVLVTETEEPAEAVSPPALGEVHYLNRRSGHRRSLVAWLLRFGGRYRAVHYHAHVDRTFLASLSVKVRGRRVVLSATLDDSVPGVLKTYRPLWRPLVRKLFWLVDRFVAISPKLHAETNQVIPPMKSELVPIGIPLTELTEHARENRRAELGVPANALMLVCVAGICARKGQLFLVQQLPELLRRHRELLLVLVGPAVEVEYAAQVERFILENGLDRNVRLAGFTDDPTKFYEAADLMVFASTEEGFGTAVIEAMAHGLPVVARRLPGVNDVFVDEGRSGYLFESGGDYLRYVEALLADRSLRNRIGAAARAFVAKRYAIEPIAARYLAIYGVAPVRSHAPRGAEEGGSRLASSHVTSD